MVAFLQKEHTELNKSGDQTRVFFLQQFENINRLWHFCFMDTWSPERMEKPIGIALFTFCCRWWVHAGGFCTPEICQSPVLLSHQLISENISSGIIWYETSSRADEMLGESGSPLYSFTLDSALQNHWSLWKRSLIYTSTPRNSLQGTEQILFYSWATHHFPPPLPRAPFRCDMSTKALMGSFLWLCTIAVNPPVEQLHWKREFKCDNPEQFHSASGGYAKMASSKILRPVWS